MFNTLSYISDERDIALFEHAPLFIQPIYGELPNLEVGKKRFVMGKDGLYLQAQNHALYVCMLVQKNRYTMPYGNLGEDVIFRKGLINAQLKNQIFNRSVEFSPKEYACLVQYIPELDNYALIEPEIFNNTNYHIKYDNTLHDPDKVLVDIHTHGANSKAYFSKTDDLDDISGIHISVVLGNCQSLETITSKTRICIYGMFFDVTWNPFVD